MHQAALCVDGETPIIIQVRFKFCLLQVLVDC